MVPVKVLRASDYNVSWSSPWGGISGMGDPHSVPCITTPPRQAELLKKNTNIGHLFKYPETAHIYSQWQSGWSFPDYYHLLLLPNLNSHDHNLSLTIPKEFKSSKRNHTIGSLRLLGSEKAHMGQIENKWQITWHWLCGSNLVIFHSQDVFLSPAVINFLCHSWFRSL